MAWDCLTKQEQDSLFLNTGQGLSTRRTGEILGMSHYKYLEMKARAEKFFKMFSDYFYLHPSLIRPGAPLTEAFKDYLYGSILKRLTKDEAVNYAGDSTWILKEFNTKKITVNMERLKASEDPWDIDLYKLIMEFDRWNSFRILPQLLQAPSAYKRRTNKKYKVYLRYLHRIPDFKIRYLLDVYWKKSGKVRYIALVSSIFEYGYQLVPIDVSDKVTKELTDMKIYQKINFIIISHILNKQKHFVLPILPAFFLHHLHMHFLVIFINTHGNHLRSLLSQKVFQNPFLDTIIYSLIDCNL